MFWFDITAQTIITAHNIIIIMSNNAAAAAVWQKEKWIKDILAKSGTELTEIKQETNASATADATTTSTTAATGKGAVNFGGGGDREEGGGETETERAREIERAAKPVAVRTKHNIFTCGNRAPKPKLCS